MTDPIAAPATVIPPKHLTRTGIMLTILPAVTGALASIPEVKEAQSVPLTLATFPLIRRAFRAILTIGVRLMLDAGVDPKIVALEAVTAIANEVKEREDLAKQQGATQAPAILPS